MKEFPDFAQNKNTITATDYRKQIRKHAGLNEKRGGKPFLINELRKLTKQLEQ